MTTLLFEFFSDLHKFSEFSIFLLLLNLHLVGNVILFILKTSISVQEQPVVSHYCYYNI